MGRGNGRDEAATRAARAADGGGDTYIQTKWKETKIFNFFNEVCMSRNDDIDFVSENTFKVKLRKLYRLTIDEGLKHNIDLNYFDFVNCEGFNDIIDVYYTNYEQDFTLSVRGSEKKGYRVLNSVLDDSLTEEDYY